VILLAIARHLSTVIPANAGIQCLWPLKADDTGFEHDQTYVF